MTASRTLMGTAARASFATAFMACGATADFTAVTTEANLVDQTGWSYPDARTLYVVSVFANFDDPANHLISVFGEVGNVLSVETSDDDGFWQFDGGGVPGDYNTSKELAAALSAIYASVTSDSFVTIGLTDSTDNNMLDIGIDFTSFNDASISSAIDTDNGTWFITPDDTQGVAGNYSGNRVLIGQFTVGEGESVTGSVNLQWRDAAGGSTFYAYSGTFDGVAGVDAGKHDMNGDGIADVLWRNSAGTGSKIYAWLVDASDPADLTYTGDYLFDGTTQLNSWEIAGTGDFDGDGLADILWRDPSNRMFVWKTRYDAAAVDPLTYEGDWLYTGTGLATWTIEAVADMTGDGIADVLWRNSSGAGSKIYAWIVDATDPADLTYTGDYLFDGTTQLNSWEIAGTGDMDGDSLADILWRDPSNRMFVWKTRYDAVAVDPLTYEGDWLYTGTGLATWTIEAVADMTGDGIADVLWRNSSGAGSKIYAWIVDATDPADLTYTGDYLFDGTTQLNSWEISGLSDMDGDSLADVLWRDPSNRIFVWKTRYDAVAADPLTYVGDWLYTGTGLATWTIENQD